MAKRKFFILLLLLLDIGITRNKSEFLHEMPADIQRFAEEKRLPHGGFTSFHISRPLHKDDTGRLAPFHSQRLLEKSSNNDDIEIHLPFENETMILQLKTGFSVLHPSSSVSLSDGDKEEVITNGPFRNCYLCGHVVSHDGIASFSHCGDGLEGAMRTNELEFLVNVLPTELAHRHKRSAEEQPYLVAKRSTNYDLYSTNMKVEMENLARNVKTKVKREAENVTDLIVEIAVYTDAGLTKSLERDNSMFSLERKIDFVVTKYNGVQYEFWKYNELGGYNITIQLKKISFFTKDPMTNYRDDTIDSVLEAFCKWQQPRLPYDHVMLLSSKVVEKPGGRAYRPGVCKPDFRCAVSTIVHWGFWYIETHELGHNLGMDHNDNTDCREDPAEKQGLMGKRRTGWSPCSTRAFKTLISSHGAECLFKENIPPEMVDPNTIGIVLNGYLPGMYLTPDETCEARHGADYRYRAYSELNQCMYHACVYMKAGPEYGIMKVHRYGLAGLYCGSNKICLLSLHCVEISSLNLKAPVIIQAGGWGSWGPWSDCIPSCGKGVRYREHFCTNPKPLNSPACTGHRYMSAPCEGQPCADNKNDDLTIALKKSIEICRNFLKQGKISNKYIGEGGLYGIDEFSVCEISCFPRSASNYDRFDRFGLLPDGTPCRVLSTIPEPTRFKTQSICIKGSCQDVGCDGDISGKKFDVCGVCGGTGSTCKRINGVLEVQPQDVISEVLEIPGSASNIAIKFNLTNDDEAFLMLWSKDNVPVLDPGLNVTRTLWDPIQFTKANWDYNSQSFISADGPTEQPVKIKVLIATNATARSLIYNYSLPLVPPVGGNCPEKCYNNGTLSQCACKCTDYYGGRDCKGCNTVCINGGVINETTCECKCPSPRMQPPRCECQKWYRGRNCSQCQFTPCGSCGTFDWEKCHCMCQPGFGGTNCEHACNDKLGEECLQKAKDNECETNFQFMLENCEKTCTFCSMSDSLSPSCNPDISMKSFDKERDAGQLSDTFFFETTNSHNPSECPPYEILCDEKTCVSFEKLCDGQVHCSNGLDENDKACRALKILSGCPNTCGQFMMICVGFLLASIGHFLH